MPVSPKRHFGPGSVSSAGSSSSVSVGRRADLTDDEREKLRAAAKQSSDEYFARGKANKEAGLRRLRQRRGPFKMPAKLQGIKYGTPVSERPVARRRPPLNAVDIGRPEMGSKGINEENLSDSQRTLLRRMRRRRV